MPFLCIGIIKDCMTGGFDDTRLCLHHAEPHLGPFKQGVGYRYDQKRYQQGQGLAADDDFRHGRS